MDDIASAQRDVAQFIDEHDLTAPPEFRLLDLTAEIGELAKDACESTEYGTTSDVSLARDELGDALFALLALTESLDYDAAAALGESLSKYEKRITTSGDAGSGE